MPSKSPEQHKLMEIAAHTKGGYGGVSQSVGKDFVDADKAKGENKSLYSRAKEKMYKDKK